MRIARVTLACAVVMALTAMGFATDGETQTAKEAAKPVDFNGKTITIIVGSSAGGGWDTGARSTALTLEKILPGNPGSSCRTSREVAVIGLFGN